MIRGLTLLALTAALTAPAFAEPAVTSDASTAAAQKAELAAASGALEARQHLARQGYVNISELTKNENGLWTGAATKDGKTNFVAIDLRSKNAAAGAN
jgi:putative membrane protein